MDSVSKTQVEARHAFVRLLRQRRSKLQAEAHERAFLHLLDQGAFGHRLAFKHARKSTASGMDCGSTSLRYQLIAKEFFSLPPELNASEHEPRTQALVERLRPFFATQKMRRWLIDLIVRRVRRYQQACFRDKVPLIDDLVSVSWSDDRDSPGRRIFSTKIVHLLAQELQRDEDALRGFLCAMFEHWHNLLYSGKSLFRLSWNLHEIAPELDHDWTAIWRELQKRGLPVPQFRCDELGRVTNDVTESLRQLSSYQCKMASPAAKQEQCLRSENRREELPVAAHTVISHGI
jgi:hypothetical protein